MKDWGKKNKTKRREEGRLRNNKTLCDELSKKTDELSTSK